MLYKYNRCSLIFHVQGKYKLYCFIIYLKTYLNDHLLK